MKYSARVVVILKQVLPSVPKLFSLFSPAFCGRYDKCYIRFINVMVDIINVPYDMCMSRYIYI